MRLCARLLLPALLGGLAGAPAGAETFTVTFSGLVTEVNHVDLEAFFQVGEPFQGRFRYDDGTLDERPSASFGSYAASDFRFTIGGDPMEGATGFIEVGDGELFGGDTVDFYRAAVICEAATPCAGSFGDFAPGEFELVLVDGSQAVFADDSLPAGLSLTDFDGMEAAVSFTSDLAAGLVVASVDSLTLVAPAPAAPLLLGVGACALLGARPRGKLPYRKGP